VEAAAAVEPRAAEAANALMLEIARCPLVAECLERGNSAHACSTIVLDQWKGVGDTERRARWRTAHQLPEPWDGHLATARILFVSSNPSISGNVHSARPAEVEAAPPEEFRGFTADRHPSIRKLGQGPRWTWEDDEIVDRYEAAFDVYIRDGIRGINPDGSTTGATRFWIEVKARARELIPHRPVRLGIDYGLTEAVRCKSRGEVGVKEGLATCSSRYLRRTLEAAARA
jgi:hypothetical protein